MQAYVIHHWGEVDQLKLEEIPQPIPKPREVIIRVACVGLNRLDYNALSGNMEGQIAMPAVLGTDVSGVIEAVGSEVQNLQPDDAVMGMINFPGTDVTYTGHGYGQFAPTPADQVVKKPTGLSFEAAAALPAVGLTAWQALVDKAHIKKGQRVLIHGGAGGVGHMGVQIARNLGAYVIVTSDGKDTDFVKSLGAREVIDYKTQRFEELVKDVDVVFDTVGGEVLRRSLNVLKRGGTVVTTLWPQLDNVKDEATAMHITAVAVAVTPNADQLSQLAQAVADSKLTVHVDTVYPFDQLPLAVTRLRTGGMRGKLVVTVAEPAHA